MRPVSDPSGQPEPPVTGLARGRRQRLAVAALAGVFALSAATLAPADPAATYTFTTEEEGPIVRGEPVTFTATAECVAPVTCTWWVSKDAATEAPPDDDPAGQGRRFVHRFEELGPHTVTLEVDDPEAPGEPNVYSEPPIEVVNQPPRVSFTYDADGLDVAFASAASDDDADDQLTYAWDFGDDTPVVNATNPRHPYATPGTYEVTLTVDDSHEERTFSDTVTVAPANADPTAAFAFTTDGLTATFDASSSSDPDAGDDLTYTWDFGDSARAEGRTVTHAYAAADRFPVRLTVSDGSASDSVTREVLVNRAPVANFDWSPTTVERGQPVTFTSRSSDADRSQLTETWDLDGDGAYDDAFGPVANHTFDSIGTHEVGLRVSDVHGAATVARLPVVLGNRTPVAAFSVSPERPVAGQVLTLTSESSDPDGAVSWLAWDLDGDGAFDDASGPRAERRVTAAGRVTVGLRVVDNDGGVDVTQRAVDVAGAVQEPRPAPDAAPRLLKPFPAVRVAGRLSGAGAVFRLVSVRAPRGARVAWSCSARRCRGGRRTAAGGVMRIRALERRFGAGVVLEFRVTRPGFIGKYTRIQVRRSRAPGRRDLCLRSASGRPFTCPS